MSACSVWGHSQMSSMGGSSTDAASPHTSGLAPHLGFPRVPRERRVPVLRRLRSLRHQLQQHPLTKTLTFLKVLLDLGIPTLEHLSESGKQPGALGAYIFLPLDYGIDVLIKYTDFLSRRETSYQQR